MLVKVILLFLVVIAAIGWIGSLVGRPPFRPPRRRPPLLSARCPDCGRPRIGKGPCDCKDRG